MNTLSRILLGLIMAMGGATISVAAFANNFDDYNRVVRSTVVKYGDLDLARQAGIRTLYHRLSRAGYTVCGQIPGFNPFDLRSPDDWNACYEHALDNAAAKVGNPRLTQMIFRKIGPPAETKVASR